MDVIAGRLRALIHFDVTGRWREAEQLQADSARDLGLADFQDLYRAKRMARLTAGADSSSSSGEERKKKKKRGKGKKGKKKKKDDDAPTGGNPKGGKKK